MVYARQWLALQVQNSCNKGTTSSCASHPIYKLVKIWFNRRHRRVWGRLEVRGRHPTPTAPHTTLNGVVSAVTVAETAKGQFVPINYFTLNPRLTVVCLGYNPATTRNIFKSSTYPVPADRSQVPLTVRSRSALSSSSGSLSIAIVVNYSQQQFF